MGSCQITLRHALLFLALFLLFFLKVDEPRNLEYIKHKGLTLILESERRISILTKIERGSM